MAVAILAGMTITNSVPDSDRYVAYTPNTSTTTFDVPFAVWAGTTTEALADLEIRVNGAVVTSGISFTGTFDTDAQPNVCLNGQIVFTTGQSGVTVEIEGFREPRRVSQYPDGVGVVPRNQNSILNAIVASGRELRQRSSRAPLSPRGETSQMLPARSALAGRLLQGDDSGNLIAGRTDASITTDFANETSAREAADATLQSNIDTEAGARGNADATLQANINAEATARSGADANEATSRQNADSSLSDRMTLVEEAIVGGVGTVAALGIRSFQTTTALAAAATGSIADDQVVLALGGAVAGDGAGGLYQITSTDPGAGGIAIAAPAKWARVVDDASLNIRRFGAKGDGTTDCDTAFSDSQEWIAGEITAGRKGRPIPLADGDTYVVNASVLVGDYGGFVGMGRGATVYAPASSFNNTATTITSDGTTGRYGSSAAVFNLSGLKSGLFTPRKRPTLRGFVIQSEVSDGRMVDAIVAQNVEDLRIESCEFFGFPVGCDIRAATLSGQSLIARNKFHDRTDDTTGWVNSNASQMTAVEIDNDLVNSVASVGFRVLDNDIENITQGATALAFWAAAGSKGMQTDGINIANCGATNYVIRGNRVYNVGEGIDDFGSRGVVAGNTITKTYNFGIKLIHGAQKNAVYGNFISAAGLAGIILTTRNDEDDTQDVSGNIVANNVIENMDPDNIWSGHDRACIMTTTVAGTPTFNVNDNIIDGNVLDPGANGEYNILGASTGKRNDYIANKIKSIGTGNTLARPNGETGRYTPATLVAVRAHAGTAGTACAAGASTTLVFDTVDTDTANGYAGSSAGSFGINTTSGVITVPEPGIYDIEAQARFGVFTSTANVQIKITKNGTSTVLGQSGKVDGGDAAGSGLFAAVRAPAVSLSKGDAIQVVVVNNDSASRTPSVGAQFTWVSLRHAA